ncbi:MAG: type IV pilus modification protein PilV [Pseudomonadota bacterium]
MKYRHQFRAAARRVRGFTLIEVLVAMVVMAIGMLGIAGMYVHSLQAGRTSQLRTQAVLLASDVADRVRANPLGGIAYIGAGANNNCDDATPCDALALASYDIWLWNQQRDRSMPQGTQVTVRYDDTIAGQPPVYTVRVTWPEAGETPFYEIEFGAVEF